MTDSNNASLTSAVPRFSAVIREFSFKSWLYSKRYYLIAFAVPCIIMYFAYAIFGFYPFGGRSVLVLDLNGQYVYYFEYIREAFWGRQSMLYSWSRNLSGEFLGVFAYYLASPFTLIVTLLPRQMILGSILIMQLAKLGAASCAMLYFLQNSRKIKAMPALICSILYGLCAYAVYQLMDPMWLDGLIYMPLIAIGLERMLDTGKKTGYIVPLALMFIANFYIGWMCGFFTAFYFLYYITVGTDKEKRSAKEISYASLRFVLSTLVACMCAAFMLLSVYASLSLGKLDFTEPDFSFKLQFKAFDMLTKLLPNSYDTVRNEGLPAIYSGILATLAVPLYYMNSEIPFKKKIGNTFLLAVLFFSMYIKPIDMAWHGFQVPNWLPYRYSFLFSFVLLSMTAVSLNHIKGVGFGEIGAVFFGVFALLIYIDTREYEHIHTMMTIWISVGFAAAFCILLHFYRQRPNSILVPSLMLGVVAGELLLNCENNVEDIHVDVVYSARSTYYPRIDPIMELADTLYEKDNSFYRTEKVWHRTVNDALAVGTRSISHSSSTMNARIIKYIGKLGLTSRGHYTKYTGATPVSDMLLGIKYVFDNDSSMAVNGDGAETPIRGKFISEYYDYVLDENDLFVYQNPFYAGIGYTVNEGTANVALLENKNPFETQNYIVQTMMADNSLTCFNKLMIDDIYFNNVEEIDAIDQMRYKRTSEGDAYIDIIVTAKDDNPVYFYIPTKYERQVNLWTKSEWLSEENTWRSNFIGATDLVYVNKYFETEYYCIMKLGSYSAGQKFVLRMTIPPGTEDTYMQGSPLFYSFDSAALEEVSAQLQKQTWNIKEYSDTYLKGTVNASASQILFTSIPSEPGWTVKIDGKKAEIIEVFDAFTAVKIGPGEHTVEMSYTPVSLIKGLVITGAGIILTVFIFLWDNNANIAIIQKFKKEKYYR